MGKPYQRSDPKKLAADREAIRKSMESMEEPDSESKESKNKRLRKIHWPQIKGAEMVGFKKMSRKA